MSADHELLAALETSLAALDPASDAARRLKLHLAGQYVAAARPQRAHELAEQVLVDRPEDAEALALAALAAAAMGKEDRADELRNTQARLLGQDDVAVSARATDELTDWPTEVETITLADVHGMETAKRQLVRGFFAPLQNPELAQAFAKDLRGGLLLWGPPGTGKTFLARAVAGELSAKFLSATPADIYNSYFGQSEQNIARLFREARAAAPSVIFLDELDALGGRRSERHQDQTKGVVNQLLTELDGMASNRGVFLLAATNAPWDVDSALRRPGRFDRTVVVLPPDEPARRALLTAELASRPTLDVDVEAIVRRTETYTGADLVSVVTTAAELALERSIDLGVTSPINNADLHRALQDTRPSAHAWFNQAASYVAYAKDTREYDELRTYLRAHRLG